MLNENHYKVQGNNLRDASQIIKCNLVVIICDY